MVRDGSSLAPFCHRVEAIKVRKFLYTKQPPAVLRQSSPTQAGIGILVIFETAALRELRSLRCDNDHPLY